MEMYTHILRPFIDGEFIPRDPREMYADGEVNQVSIMTGCLSEEGNLFIIPPDLGLENPDKPILNKTSYEGLVSMFVPNADELVLDTVAMVYMPPEEVCYRQKVHILLRWLNLTLGLI